MRLPRVVGQLRELAEVTRAARRTYGGSALATARRARRARREGAWTYTGALGAGVLDPAHPDEVWTGFISSTRLQAAQWRHNPLTLEPLTEHKLICDRHLAAIGIPCAETFGTVGREGGWDAARAAAVDDPEAFARFLAALPEEVVIKPAEGLLGLRVRLVRRLPDGRVDAGEGPVPAAALFDALVGDPDFGLFVVQRRLRNHDGVRALCDVPGLTTLRVATFVRRDGTVHVMHAALKLATGGGAADNFNSGRTGNGVADVDLEDGRLGPLTFARPGGGAPYLSAVVPATGRRVQGEPTPMLAEACALARRAAPAFLPMRTLGFDIALTPDGPVVVEVNNYWGAPYTPMPAASRALLLET